MFTLSYDLRGRNERTLQRLDVCGGCGGRTEPVPEEPSSSGPVLGSATHPVGSVCSVSELLGLQQEGKRASRRKPGTLWEDKKGKAYQPHVCLRVLTLPCGSWDCVTRSSSDSWILILKVRKGRGQGIGNEGKHMGVGSHGRGTEHPLCAKPQASTVRGYQLDQPSPG